MKTKLQSQHTIQFSPTLGNGKQTYIDANLKVSELGPSLNQTEAQSDALEAMEFWHWSRGQMVYTHHSDTQVDFQASACVPGLGITSAR